MGREVGGALRAHSLPPPLRPFPSQQRRRPPRAAVPARAQLCPPPSYSTASYLPLSLPPPTARPSLLVRVAVAQRGGRGRGRGEGAGGGGGVGTRPGTPTGHTGGGFVDGVRGEWFQVRNEELSSEENPQDTGTLDLAAALHKQGGGTVLAPEQARVLLAEGAGPRPGAAVPLGTPPPP